jgi:hypothetical protein
LGWQKLRSKNHVIKKAGERAEAPPAVVDQAAVDARVGVVRMVADGKAVATEVAVVERIVAVSTDLPRSTSRS